MTTAEHILVAVDDSEASRKAVSYVGRLLSDASDCEVRLFHVVEPIGPSWDTLHGDMTTESRAPAGAPETHLIEEAKRQSRPVFEKMLGILEQAGSLREKVACSWFTASREDSLVSDLLDFAREQGCRTVVVGRTALPWYRELFKQHLGERLVKKAEGMSVWVVE